MKGLGSFLKITSQFGGLGSLLQRTLMTAPVPVVLSVEMKYLPIEFRPDPRSTWQPCSFCAKGLKGAQRLQKLESKTEEGLHRLQGKGLRELRGFKL